MRYNQEWKDFSVIATSDGEKLERWGEYHLLRPDPQVIWGGQTPLKFYPNIDAHYLRQVLVEDIGILKNSSLKSGK